MSCGTLTRDEVVRRRAAGASTHDIATAAGVSVDAVCYHLRAAGIALSRGGDRRSPSWQERLRERIVATASLR